MDINTGNNFSSPEKFKIFIITTGNIQDTSLPIAASKAGAFGIVNLEYSADVRQALSSIEKIAKLGGPFFGMKISAFDETLSASLQETLSVIPPVVILSGPPSRAMKRRVSAWHSLGSFVIIEAINLKEAIEAQKSGANGIIAKGNEAGGRVGEETTFILLQRLKNVIKCEIYPHGGIGLHTIGACTAAGASGGVLDWPLCLSFESALGPKMRKFVSSSDSLQTMVIRGPDGERIRVLHTPQSSSFKSFEVLAAKSTAIKIAKEKIKRDWWKEVQRRTGWSDPEQHLIPMGQDACFAISIARRFKRLKDVIETIKQNAFTYPAESISIRPLCEGGPLAESHNTRFPIVQGPMSWVSDNPEFASAIADKGALPTIALGQLKGNISKKILKDTRKKLIDKSWGAGLLGFITPQILKPQLKAIQDTKPPYVLLAGGRPDQARSLEDQGIKVYAHVPTTAILQLFYNSGHRRFILEGNEAGGHVGPYSSFVLWELMTNALLQLIGSDEKEAKSCRVLYAGGIHDRQSVSMLEAITVPLTKRGVRIGVVMGTAYLFTHEAVNTGALSRTYQDVVVGCKETGLLETGPGHSTRCVITPYYETFIKEKKRLSKSQIPKDQVKKDLEHMNLGRLRIAAKGEKFILGKKEEEDRIRKLSSKEQLQEGLYMIGQAASLRSNKQSVEQLHLEVSGDSREPIPKKTDIPPLHSARKKRDRNDIAIIAVSCFLPGSENVKAFWKNICHKKNSLQEIPKERWDWRIYYSQDRYAKDKIYSKWGGFIDDVLFDPFFYGMPPSSVKSIDPVQLLTLEAVKTALDNAGYSELKFNRDRTSVIIGTGGGIPDHGIGYTFRSMLPHYLNSNSSSHHPAEDIISALGRRLPEWTEESFAGFLGNVSPGRVANRFDLGGTNFSVDAACASSLAAVEVAVRMLQAGTCDMAIVGGCDTMMSPFVYLSFSKTQALSPSGHCRPLSSEAEGIIISEGIVITILKRLSDAEKDGDHIYAVIKGTGSSSDGKAKGITAPSARGQIRALEQAYTNAATAPESIDLIEMHATGTLIGDSVEIEALQEFFGFHKDHSCALGTVKSMIGHTKSAAGLASLAKTALALHYKILPPTLGVTNPNPLLENRESPFYINTETRPWIKRKKYLPRRAGVSAFGFGGTNFHAVLEEYDHKSKTKHPRASHFPRDTELFLWKGGSVQEISDKLEYILHNPASSQNFAWYAGKLAFEHDHHQGHLCLSIVARSPEDLMIKIRKAKSFLISQDKEILFDPTGIYFTATPLLSDKAKLAFLFPGQGSQYTDMLSPLALEFECVRKPFEDAGFLLSSNLPRLLGDYIFPQPVFIAEEQKILFSAIKETNIAQPALGAAEWGMYSLLSELNIVPDMMAGHSYGELPALCAAGIFDEEELYRLSEMRGRFMAAAGRENPGIMAAVMASSKQVHSVTANIKDVSMANMNSPKQTVISGTNKAIRKSLDRLKKMNIPANLIPVSCSFHTSSMKKARDQYQKVLSDTQMNAPKIPVYSNLNASIYRDPVQDICHKLAELMVNPVCFQRVIETMYKDSARVFLEVGPKNILTNLTNEILKGKDFCAIATDHHDKKGNECFFHALAKLASEGAPLSAGFLYQQTETPWLKRPPKKAEKSKKDLWLVNGYRAVPLDQKDQTSEKQRSEPSLFNGLTLGSENTQAQELIDLLQKEKDPENKGEILKKFQKLMNHFLKIQKEVYQSYLQSAHNQENQETRESQKEKKQNNTFPEASPENNQNESHSEHDDKDDIQTKLLDIICERTGYPKEMLDLDLDIEADLGVSSIKRIEILSIFQQKYLPYALNDDDMEKISSLRTLRDIIQIIQNKQKKSPINKKDSPAPQSNKTPRSKRASKRYVPCVVEADAVNNPLSIKKNSILLITDDGRGIARKFASRIKKQGFRPVLLSMHETHSSSPVPCFRWPFRDPEKLDHTITQLKNEIGPPSGLIHLAPLNKISSFLEMSHKQWRTRLEQDIKSLFLLFKAVENDLKLAAQSGEGLVFGATQMGGTFGFNHNEIPVFPGHGGITGFLKSLAHEYPEFRIRCLDFSPKVPNKKIIDILAEEFLRESDSIEVGFDGNKRMTLGYKKEDLTNGQGHPLIDSSSHILILGGARGITALLSHNIAKQYKPTLIIAGRSSLPSQEDPLLSKLKKKEEIIQKLIEKKKSSAETYKPIDIEKTYQRLMRDREIRENLSSLKEAGARCEYHSVDVRNEKEVIGLVDYIYEKFGRLDGVIYGAGIIEDKLCSEKTYDSFNRVFDTKAHGAFTLIQRLRKEDLKFLVFFSSIAGIFGNRGQTDYAAGNEILNKLALSLANEWPARIISINWGPWESKGMVSPELKKEFLRQGINLIDPEKALQFMDSELRSSEYNQPEVIFASMDWPIPSKIPDQKKTSQHTSDRVIQINRLFSLENDIYLKDHIINGKPVLPLAFALEWIQRAVLENWPEYSYVSFQNLSVTEGIVFNSLPKTIHLFIHPNKTCSGKTKKAKIMLSSSDKKSKHFYQTNIKIFSDALIISDNENFLLSSSHRPKFSLNETYNSWLFHGPCFHHIKKIKGINRQGIIGTIEAVPASFCLSKTKGKWSINPFILDCALQFLLIWTRQFWDTTGYPMGFQSLESIENLSNEPYDCWAKVYPEIPGQMLRSDITLFDRSEVPVVTWKGIEVYCRKDWNISTKK
jgi:acyl transferase domain-containing protein/NAD(P)H-dependent flavin oxidoreductase YrpB (nitropropane dioxygenase family)